MSIPFKPEGYHTVTPYLVINGAASCIDFMRLTFDAVLLEQMFRPDGMIAHAEISIGDSIIMLTDSSDKFKPLPSAFYLYIADVDTTYRRALEAGATSLMEPANQFYGDRNAGIIDTWGNSWWLATRIENLSREELMKRASEVVPS